MTSNALQVYLSSVGLLIPEFCVVAAILFAALWNLFVPKHKVVTQIVCVLGLTSSAVLFAVTNHPVIKAFNGLFTADALTSTFGMLVAIVGIVVVLMTMGYEHHLGNNTGEFYAILLTAVLAVMLLAGSTDLIMLFVALETLSICCVLLSGFLKRDVRSGEASLKYLLSTAATTATLLYGISFMYGLTGSTSFDVLTESMTAMASGTGSLLKDLILMLILSAIGFKLSTVPFHMWTPDVYEGAPTPVTAFLSIGSKAGGFAIALRLLLGVFGQQASDWVPFVMVMAMASMIGGNLIALSQSSFKRMLAYSSIAHVGYILIGIIAGTVEGLSAAVFYIIVYGFMNLGAFTAAILFSNQTGSDRIDDYAGLVRKRPVLSIAMAICLFNLAGLPVPPAGFFAKFFVFNSILQSSVLTVHGPAAWLLLATALGTSIPAIFYYVRVVIKMFVREPSEVVKALPADPVFVGSPQFGPIVALCICLLIIVSTGTNGVETTMRLSRQTVARFAPGTETPNLPLGYKPDNDL